MYNSPSFSFFGLPNQAGIDSQKYTIPYLFISANLLVSRPSLKLCFFKLLFRHEFLSLTTRTDKYYSNNCLKKMDSQKLERTVMNNFLRVAGFFGNKNRLSKTGTDGGVQVFESRGARARAQEGGR